MSILVVNKLTFTVFMFHITVTFSWINKIIYWCIHVSSSCVFFSNHNISAFVPISFLLVFFIVRKNYKDENSNLSTSVYNKIFNVNFSFTSSMFLLMNYRYSIKFIKNFISPTQFDGKNVFLNPSDYQYGSKNFFFFKWACSWPQENKQAFKFYVFLQ